MSDTYSFNDLMKKLEGAGSTNPDGQVQALADKLLAQGIAMNQMAAREKARNMLAAEVKAQKGFEKKREDLTQYNDPRSQKDHYRNQNIEELRKRAMEGPRMIKVQDNFQTPKYERENGSAGLPNAVPGISRERQGMAPRPLPEAQPMAKPEPKVEVVPMPEPRQERMPKPEMTPQPEATPQPETRPQPEPTPEASPLDTTSENQRKKNPEVDLGNIFNFGKK